MNIRIIIGTVAILSVAPPSLAQVVGDGLLQQPTHVTGCPSNCLITGGIAAGGNLFHSFSQFSLPTGSNATFQPEPAITRIFGRVTSGQISQIDGELRVNGNADLFLINPAGIQFGPNARLNLNGSFIGTTAQSIDFGDGIKFGVGSNLLSINTPIGLEILRASGGISVQGNATPLDVPSSTGLSVPVGNTLALVGHGLDFNQATIVAPAGNVELHSVASGSIKVTQDALGYRLQPVNIKRANVNISHLSQIAANGSANNHINLSGNLVTLQDGSILSVQPLGTLSNSGNITIQANQLKLTDGSSINGQNIDIQSNAIVLAGTLANAQSSRIFSPTSSSNNVGIIRIDTNTLDLRDGANISSNAAASESASNIEINARQSIRGRL